MTFLPVVHRELQIAARQRRTHWMRVSAPVIAFGVLFVMAGTSINWQDKDKVGQNSFHMISGLTMVYCLLVGMWATSDCLSRERREGTLGLLFLTDLSGADVVLGKLAASSTRMFYGLIAVFPILGVPLLLGGVTIGEYGRMCLVLMGGMFLSLSIGMFASSLCRSAEASMGTAFGLLFVLSVILPSWHFSFLGAHPSDWGVIFLSPTLGLILTLEKLNISDPAAFWIWLALNQLLCWSLLQFACRRSVASRIEKKAAARRTPTKQEENELRYQSLLNTHKRRHLLDINPILWLVTRQRLRQKAIWLFVCVIILVPVFFLPIMGRDFFDPSMCLFLILGSHGVIKAWAASEAANLIVENRKNETFELLSSTRLTGADFFDGQLIAIRRQFRAPILTILTFDC
ncbi:MAG: ABC-type transport system involved in multi-copper enzyme maturation permease subunit, partial [Limisphaerales bacterium]